MAKTEIPTPTLAPQEQELAALVSQLRMALQQTLPDLDRRVNANRQSLLTLNQKTTALDLQITGLRADRKVAAVEQEKIRTSFDRRLARHRGDIDGLKKNLSADIHSPLGELRDLHAKTKPLLAQLQSLAASATPSQKATENIATHSAAILGLQGHLMALLRLAKTLEDNVGRRLQVAQSDPRKLTLSCGEYIDKLNTIDGHWRAVISGFSNTLIQRDRVVTDVNFHPDFHVVNATELKALGQKGFLPPVFKDFSKQYAALYAGGKSHDLQELLKDVVLVAAQYPEMVLKELQRVLGGVYVTIDQDLLVQFSDDVSFLMRDTLALDCKMVPDGDTSYVHKIPSSHAPMTYAMGVPCNGKSAPDLSYTTFSSGFSFTDSIGSRTFSPLRPPAIKVSLDK